MSSDPDRGRASDRVGVHRAGGRAGVVADAEHRLLTGIDSFSAMTGGGCSLHIKVGGYQTFMYYPVLQPSMAREFIEQIFTETGSDYDRLVVSDGMVMVTARLVDDSVYIQTDRTTAHDALSPKSVELSVTAAQSHLEDQYGPEVHVV